MTNTTDVHTCHHPSCDLPVPPKMLACRKHWYQLPMRLRNAVWRTYRPGQEIDKRPSREYIAVIEEVQAFWRGKEAAGQMRMVREGVRACCGTGYCGCG